MSDLKLDLSQHTFAFVGGMLILLVALHVATYYLERDDERRPERLKSDSPFPKPGRWYWLVPHPYVIGAIPILLYLGVLVLCAAQ